MSQDSSEVRLLRIDLRAAQLANGKLLGELAEVKEELAIAQGAREHPDEASARRQVQKLRERNVVLSGEIRQLNVALTEYGMHLTACEFAQFPDGRCDCGLSALIHDGHGNVAGDDYDDFED